MCNLSRRSYSPTPGTSGVTKPATNDNLSVTKPGVHHQLGKICDKSNTANRVSGLSHRFILDANVTTHAQIWNIMAWIKELYLLADADFYFCRQGGSPIWWRKSEEKKWTTTTQVSRERSKPGNGAGNQSTTRVAGVIHNITTHTSVKNARYSICLKIACICSKFHKRSNALISIASD